MGGQEVQQFLTHLAVDGRVAASTQRQALRALLFLSQQVLTQDMGWIDDVVRAKPPHRVPVVLTQDEVAAVCRHLSGTGWPLATWLYGSGLRRLEGLRPRVQDLDFAYNQMVVCTGTGQAARARAVAAASCRRQTVPYAGWPDGSGRGTALKKACRA
jgi:site-specific recombinase XerD